jgi:geranylgeranyl diphosphate synthase, type II
MHTQQELSSIIEDNLQKLNFSSEPKELYEPLNYIINIGGKRLRPLMSLTTYDLFAEQITEQIIYPAMALEVFHNFTLIHDDIMDKADIRRGKPTVYRKWDSNIAILSGDVMSIKSYELLAKYPTEKLSEILQLFTKTAAQVCEGQQYDMNFENDLNTTIEEYIKMIGLKTAVLIACAAKMGAIIAGSNSSLCESLYEYGYKLGLAFQIQDDYLDTFGDSKTFGKTIGGDITNNKKTWLLIDCINRLKSGSNEMDKKELSSLMSLGQERAQEKIQGISALYTRSGAKDGAENAIAKYHKEAMKTIKNTELNEQQYSALEEFANMLLKREK